MQTGNASLERPLSRRLRCTPSYQELQTQSGSLDESMQASPTSFTGNNHTNRTKRHRTLLRALRRVHLTEASPGLQVTCIYGRHGVLPRVGHQVFLLPEEMPSHRSPEDIEHDCNHGEVEPLQKQSIQYAFVEDSRLKDSAPQSAPDSPA